MGLGGFLSAPFKAANKAVKKVSGAATKAVAGTGRVAKKVVSPVAKSIGPSPKFMKNRGM